MLPSLVEAAPDGDEWIHENKYDGYRTILSVAGARTQAFTRNGYDWTEKYAPIVAEARQLACYSAIIDGEMIVQDEEGRSDFGALRRFNNGAPQRLVLYAFDLLALNGRDLRAAPLLNRRAALESLTRGVRSERSIHFSWHIVGGGPAFFAAASAARLEGIVSKRVDSAYASGCTRAWLKTKALGRAITR